MSKTLKSYCHDFQALLKDIVSLSAIAGTIKEFDSYRERRVLATDEESIVFLQEPNKASLVITTRDGVRHEIVLNENGRVPKVKVLGKLTLLFKDHAELFHLVMERLETTRTAIRTICMEFIRKYDEPSVAYLDDTLGHPSKVVEEYLTTYSGLYLTFFVNYLASNEVAARFELGVDQSMLLGKCITDNGTRHYRETKLYLTRGMTEDHYIVIDHETLINTSNAIMHDTHDETWWYDQRVDTAQFLFN